MRWYAVCLFHQPGEIEALLMHKGGENGHAPKDASATAATDEPDKPLVTSGPKFGWIIGVFVSTRACSAYAVISLV